MERFGLERTEPRGEARIGTAEVIGWYRSPSQPRLLVIDKINGGKADALNAGILRGPGGVFCGIDADSSLEQDALLRAAVLALDTEAEFVAAGGNITARERLRDPGRGHGPDPRSREDRGAFPDRGIPPRLPGGPPGMGPPSGHVDHLRRLRAFFQTAGVGGGGYMTRRSSLGRDTVVRIWNWSCAWSAGCGKRAFPYAVSYAFDANCWTEVPEDSGSLYRQRDRWQRGLLEILTYHRRMILNLDMDV